MTRARELANFADNTAGLESLTVADITDLTATATELNKLDGVTVSTGNINSAINQIIDSSTDLNVDSNTLVVDKSANTVGIGGASGGAMFDVNGTCALGNGADISGGHVAIKSDGTGTDGAFFIANNDGTALVKVLDNGKFGINTSSPDAPLDIEATHSYNTDASNHADGLRFTNTTHGSMSIEWWHSTGSGTEFASIVGQTDDLSSGSYDDGNIVFRTKYNGSMADKMIIQSDGRIGIGTVAPQQHLEVHDSGGLAYLLINGGGGDGTTTSALQLGARSASGGNQIAQISAIRGGDTTGQLAFAVKSSANTLTERMRITSLGKVGINITSSIVGQLHVYDDSDVTNNPNSKGFRLDESAGKWLLSLGQSGVSNSSFAIRDVANTNYPVVIDGQTQSGNRPAIKIDSYGKVLVANSASTYADAEGDDLVVGNTSFTATGITICASSSGSTGLFFSATASGSGRYSGAITYDYGNRHNMGAKSMFFRTNTSIKLVLEESGALVPAVDNNYNLGSSSKRWNNIYVGDIRLSNEGSEGNKVDGTTGSWVIQEGEDDLYLLNSKNGKKYKFNISEV